MPQLLPFTRYPEPGRTKTRLIAALGPQGAAELQRLMTRHLLAHARELQRDGTAVEVRFEGGDRDRMERACGAEFDYHPQGDGDLGRRMDRAVRASLEAGAGPAVLVGCDCPGVTAETLRTAFDRLAEHDLVLGPASDGGYYLVGLRRPAPEIFTGIDWGGRHVLDQTLRAAEQAGLSTVLLDTLQDVDLPEDLDAWRRVRWQSPATSPSRISVVIPTLDEADRLAETLTPLDGADELQIIVADGGSRDATVEIARSCGALVLEGVSPRSCQLNAGATVAAGRLLLFLHADTRLPDGFDRHVRRSLEDPKVAAGAFRLAIDGAGPSLRLIQRTANLRARWIRMPYGDQGLFVRGETFHRAGGFPELPIMEDYALVRRLRRLGRIAILPQAAVTSARRWHTLGPWRTTLLNQAIVAAYHLGVSPNRLARWYRRR